MRYFTEIHLPNYHTHVFKFGKYKGQPLADVIRDDLSYIVWCYNTIPVFKLEGPYLKQVLDSAVKNLREHKSLNTDTDRKNYFSIVKFLEKFFHPNDVKKILKIVNKD